MGGFFITDVLVIIIITIFRHRPTPRITLKVVRLISKGVQTSTNIQYNIPIFKGRRKPEIPEKTCESEHGLVNHLHIQPKSRIEPRMHWCKASDQPLHHPLSPLVRYPLKKKKTLDD